MPGIVKVKIIEGRNLPVMDRSADTTDAYVELKLGNITYKTEVCRKSLNPQWNSEWYRFEMDDAELQDEPLQVRLMDHDTYSANDMIGKVYFNLNPLLLNSVTEMRGALKSSHITSPGSGCISGWFPVYDTIHGLRGEISLIIKLELFTDFNKFRQSSCGVHIFSGSMIPYGYYTENIFGFVEELVVEDDPEYQWIEKIRTPRASNEARQCMFYKMSGELQRKIGLKVLELGGNAIIGYRQCFDLEAETGGVVVRGIGTAVKLNKDKRTEITSRNSLYNPAFKIPDLTITSASGYNSAAHSDSCSVVSLCGSYDSENMFGDLMPDDRWSLCSFASGTSSNSRYTSIETLLDQTNRKPVKSGSKLLSVARYFTSSRFKRKLSLRKKQKSLLLRKFSVIEEYKPKASCGTLGLEIDEMIQESMAFSSRPKSEERWSCNPAVEEPTTCKLFNNSEHYRSSYSETSKCGTPMENTETVSFCNRNMDDAIKEIEMCIIADEKSVEVSEVSNIESSKKARRIRRSNSFMLAVSDDAVEKRSTLSAIESPPEDSIMEDVSTSIMSKVSDEVNYTPVNYMMEEENVSNEVVKIDTESAKSDFVTEVNESEVHRSNSFVQAVNDETLGIDKTRRIDSSESNSLELPKERALGQIPSRIRRSNSFLLAIGDEPVNTESGETVKTEDTVSEKLNVSSFDTVTICIAEIRELQNDSTRCMTPPISEMTPYRFSPSTPVEESPRPNKKISFGRSFAKALRRNYVAQYFSIAESPEVQKLVFERCRSEAADIESPAADEIVTPSADVDAVLVDTNIVPPSPPLSPLLPLWSLNTDNSNCIVSNNDCNDEDNNNDDNDCHVPITVDDDNCNILSEALTPSRLLMHANYRDRNTSEGDKDEDATKRETPATVDLTAKPRTMSESSVSAKANEPSKDVVGLPDSLSTALSLDVDCRACNVIHKENIEMMEYPFLTLSIYPEDFIVHVGGTVSARSVKLLGRISNIEEPETRDAWWTEIRVEIKSHMRALACNAVLNYTENTSICDEVCVLSATGTAAVVKVFDSGINTLTHEDPSRISRTSESEQETKADRLTPEDGPNSVNCCVYHIPYRKSSIPFPVKIKTCEICKRGYVADVMFVTIEPPERMPIIGQPAFMHAFAYRLKRDCKSELNAREISDGLPFLEYDLNRQLLNKLKIKGMNAIFGLNVQLSIGEKMISAYATGTAVLLSALPPPPELTLTAHGKWQHPMSRKKLNDARKLVEDTIRKNKLYYQLSEPQTLAETLAKSVQQPESMAVIEQTGTDMEYYAGSKPTCVIEVDDEDDLESVTQLIDPNPPQGFLVSASEKVILGTLPYVPKKNIQLFVQVHRYRIPSNTPPSAFSKLFYRIVQALYMKIHNRIPCSLNKVSFKMDIPEPDELQIRIVGMALALKESERVLESVSTSCSSVSELADDLILHTECEKDAEADTSSRLTPKKQIPKKRAEVTDSEIHITSLSFIPGAHINFYLGNLNFVFIRESSAVKEQTGGVNTFVNSFLSDVTSIVKSHAAGIGGNAVVNFFLNECLLITHSHKNQGQCLINVGGDVVRYAYRKM